MGDDALAKALRDEVITSAQLIRLKIDGLQIRDDETAARLVAEVMEIVEGERAGASAGAASLRSAEDTGQQEDLDQFIIELLSGASEPQSITQIHDAINATQLVDIRKNTLAVRLHRMAQGKRITNPHRGHYYVSEMELARRRKQA